MRLGPTLDLRDLSLEAFPDIHSMDGCVCFSGRQDLECADLFIFVILTSGFCFVCFVLSESCCFQ